jgi:sugar phosphate isomerase/epimerase
LRRVKPTTDVGIMTAGGVRMGARMKYGLADYGWRMWFGGGEDYDLESTLLDLKEIGYEGLERCRASSPGEALTNAATFRRLGMDFATVAGPGAEASIQWTAALGKRYVWTMGRPKDFEQICRMANRQAEVTDRWGIRTALHNHLGSPVESQEELEAFLERCPRVGLVLDTAHLAAAGGDPRGIVRKYPERLAAIHLKDWLVTNPEIGIKESWPKRGRFCELGAGNIGLDNIAVMKELVKVGYEGWILVEHDTHLQDPRKDLAISRRYLRDAGF